MKTKSLITGAGGFVGSHLLRRLLAEGHDVAIIIKPTSDLWRIQDVLSGVKVYYADLSETDKLCGAVKEIQPDLIFHFANAGVYGGVSLPDKEVVETNLIGFMNLISSLEKISYRSFINVGSSAEYGPKKMPMKESDACEPTSAYGISKLAATQHACLMAAKGKPILTLRLFSPFGPFDDHRRLISKVILDRIHGRDSLLADPTAVRDYIFIDDVADVFMEASQEAASLPGEIFNVGRGHQEKVSRVVEIIQNLLPSNSKVKWGETVSHPGESTMWEADMSKTFRAFTWRPRYTLEEGLKKTVQWFKQNHGFYSSR